MIDLVGVLIGFVIMLGLMFIGLYVGIVMFVIGVLGVLVYFGLLVFLFFGMNLWVVMNDFLFIIILLFVFLGELLLCVGIIWNMYESFSDWLSCLFGGFFYINIGVCVMFLVVLGLLVVIVVIIGIVVFDEF